LRAHRVADTAFADAQLRGWVAPQRELERRVAAGLPWMDFGDSGSVCAELTPQDGLPLVQQRRRVGVDHEDIREAIDEQPGRAIGLAVHQPIGGRVSETTRADD